RQLADKAAGDRMAHEEAGREHFYTEDDNRERGKERQRAAGGGECQTELGLIFNVYLFGIGASSIGGLLGERIGHFS
ncbi:hypothetical protein ACC695_40935, partial [Rhizobium ruizarguesonis]